MHEYLRSFINYEFQLKAVDPKQFKLERVEHLLKLLSDPHKRIKTIHIAGTKGKGSTCAFVASLLKSAGYKVGLYTSPHLNDYKERIRILSQETADQNPSDVFFGKISEQAMSQIIAEVKPHIEECRNNSELGQLSFFEVFTVLTLYYFAKEKVDFAVLETGLGGRLDATNVVDSVVCAITPISFEHTVQLGDTLEKIAIEKAGIIKDKTQTVVLGPQLPQVQAVLAERCRQVEAPFHVVGEDIFFTQKELTPSVQTFDVKGLNGEYKNLKTHLLGKHQMMNAATAIGIGEALKKHGVSLTEETVARGIQQTKCPGRFECIRTNPFVILDGAHNPASCWSLVETIRTLFPSRKVRLILGLSNDKNQEAICRQLSEIADHVVLTRANHPRASDLQASRAKDFFGQREVQYSFNVAEAFDIMQKRLSPEDILLVTGSFFVVAEARQLCRP